MSDKNGTRLPAGWTSARLSDVATIVMGQSPPSSTYNDSGVGLPFFQGKAEFGGLYPEAKVWCSRPNKIAQAEDVLLSVRAPVGPTNLAPSLCCIGRGLAAVRPEVGIALRYLLHAFRRFADDLDAKGTGTTFKAVSGQVVRSFALPIAPASEQVWIADALDELLSDLDAGVAALERVRDKLKLYRAAVLKAAVEGALTAEWREQHPQAEPASELLKRILAERRRRWEEEQLRKFKEKSREPPKNWKAKYREPVAPDTANLPPLPDRWCWASFDQIGETQGGLQKSPSRKPLRNHYPYLRVANVHRGSLDLKELHRFELTKEELERLRLQPGDLLIVEGNGSRTEIGRCALWTGEVEDCVHQNHIIRVRPLSGIVPKYADLFMNSPTGQLAIQHVASSTSGLYTLSVVKIERLPLALPPEAEQEAIIDAVEDQLSLIEHLEADLETKLMNAQALRQSILRHAFTGKLVPQDPKDEPASELLKRIAAEREQRAREAASAKRLDAHKPRRASNSRGKAARATTKETDNGRIADR